MEGNRFLIKVRVHIVENAVTCAHALYMSYNKQIDEVYQINYISQQIRV